ncbi:MAG: hypothetical protein WCI61_01485 [Chloroflexota bacterium]
MSVAQPDRLARALRALLLGDRAVEATHVGDASHLDHAARLDAIEREVQEMRTRVNALFFAVITAGVADLVARTVLR